MSGGNQEDAAKLLVGTNLEWIEECVLFCVIKDYAFWRTHCKGLVNETMDRFGKSRHSDFTKPVDNILYGLADQYYSGFEEEAGQITTDVLLNLLNEVYKKNNCSFEEFQAGVNRITEAQQVDLGEIKPFTETAFPYWLDRKRTLYYSARAGRDPRITSDELLENLRDVQRLATSGQQIPSKGIMHCMEHPEEAATVFYPVTSLRECNLPLGGGLVPTDLGLVITAPNGGKTVLANQIAADIALSRRKVVLITTEQSEPDMYARQFSAVCNIPFDKLNHGFNPEKLTEDEIRRCRNYAKRVSEYMIVCDWSGSSRTIGRDIRPTLEKLESGGFKPDVVIMDWLGGGMDEPKDEVKLRDAMISTSKTFRNYCREYNAAGVLFAQANEEQIRGVERVGGSHVDNCKMLHEYADWGVGISLLRAKDGSDSETDIQRNQKFNFFKARRNPGTLFKVERDFKYQRFKVLNDSVFNQTMFPVDMDRDPDDDQPRETEQQKS